MDGYLEDARRLVDADAIIGGAEEVKLRCLAHDAGRCRAGGWRFMWRRNDLPAKLRGWSLDLNELAL